MPILINKLSQHKASYTVRTKAAMVFAIALAWMGLFLSTFAQAGDLKAYTATYSGQIKGMTVDVERNFEVLKEGQYRVTNEADKAFASFFEQSEFSLFDDHSIQPSKYTYITQYGPIKREQDVVFDWEKKTVLDRRKSSDKAVKLDASLADRISYQEQLRQMIKTGETGTVTIDLFSRGKLKSYRYEIGTQTSVETPAGTFNSIPVKRAYSDPEKSQTLWFAIDKDYALVKFLQQDEDELFELNAKRLELGKPKKSK